MVADAHNGEFYAFYQHEEIWHRSLDDHFGVYSYRSGMWLWFPTEKEAQSLINKETAW